MSIIYNGTTISSIRFNGTDDNNIYYNNKSINEVIYNGKLVFSAPNNLTISFDSYRNVTNAYFDYQSTGAESKRSFIFYTMHCAYLDALNWGGAHTGVRVYSSQAEINTSMSSNELTSTLKKLDWANNGVWALAEKAETMGDTPSPYAKVDLFNNKQSGNAIIGSCFQGLLDLELRDVIYPIVGSVNVRYNARFLYWDWNYLAQATIISPNQRTLVNYDYRAGGNDCPRQTPDLSSKIQGYETGRIRLYGNISDLTPNSTHSFSTNKYNNQLAQFVFYQNGWGSSSVTAMCGRIG